jgi:N-acetylglucosamine kinase-like BadF-type ATPase
MRGGWGPALAIYACGHTVSQRALQESFIGLDEGDSSLFLQRALEHGNLTEIAGVVDHANRATGTSFAELVPILSECAAAGDRVSLRAIEIEAEILARLGQGCHSRGDWAFKEAT